MSYRDDLQAALIHNDDLQRTIQTLEDTIQRLSRRCHELVGRMGKKKRWSPSIPSMAFLLWMILAMAAVIALAVIRVAQLEKASFQQERALKNCELHTVNAIVNCKVSIANVQLSNVPEGCFLHEESWFQSPYITAGRHHLHLIFWSGGWQMRVDGKQFECRQVDAITGGPESEWQRNWDWRIGR